MALRIIALGLSLAFATLLVIPVEKMLPGCNPCSAEEKAKDDISLIQEAEKGAAKWNSEVGPDGFSHIGPGGNLPASGEDHIDLHEPIDFQLGTEAREAIVKMSRSYVAVTAATAQGDMQFLRRDPNSYDSPYEITDASIRRLCESGRVCAVLGQHVWKYYPEIILIPDESVPDKTTQSRTCTFCGKKQESEYHRAGWTDWK